MSKSKNRPLEGSDNDNSKNLSTLLRIGVRRGGRGKNEPLGIDPCGISSSASITSDQIKIDTITIQTLKGHILPLLPSAPLHMHNIHLKCITATNNRHYNDLKLPSYKQNTGKYQLLDIDNTRVSYVFYPNRTVDIYTKNSDNPFKLQTEADCISLINFFRKIRDNLPDQVIVSVPDIYDWEFTECDINRDIKVSDLLHFAGVKVQVKHMDHLFRVYIKKIGEENTFCRVEETKHLKKPVIEAIHDIFNPYERIEKQIAEIRRMLNPGSR